jgi:hypothetical protein
MDKIKQVMFLQTLFPNWQKESWQTFEENFWIRGTGTGQQVAQLHDRYMMMMMMMMIRVKCSIAISTQCSRVITCFVNFGAMMAVFEGVNNILPLIFYIFFF